MSKAPKLELSFLDEGDFVKAMLACDGKIFCDYENSDSKPVRVRAPIPEIENTIKMAKYWVENDTRWQSVEHWFEFLMGCRDKEIFQQVEEIRKSVKRISRLTQSKKVSMEALNEYIKSKT